MAHLPPHDTIVLAHAERQSLVLQGAPGSFVLSVEKADITVIRRTSSLAQQHEGRSSWLTAAATLVTVMVGAGVLSLPSAMSWLGWVGGPVCLAGFYAISLWCSLMLASVYKVPPGRQGRRHPTYRDAAFFILGRRAAVALVAVQRAMLFLAAVGYEIAAADSLAYIAARGCGGRAAGCVSKPWQMTLLFGGLQLLLSLLPDLESVWLVSILGAVMSIAYSLLTVGLGASQAHHALGSLWGRAAPPGAKAIGVFNALGQMAFAYGCAIVQLEVQHTLREPPDAVVSMRRSIVAATTTAFVLYALVSCLCYAALGDAVGALVLTSFADAAPWVTLLGNALVLVHMVSAFQVFCQPMFAAMEARLVACVPRLDEWAARGARRVHLVRFVYRGPYVALLTALALLFPFFGAFIGLIGSIAFWPLAVGFPMAMYAAVHRPRSAAVRAIMLLVFGATAGVSAVAAVGSVTEIVQSARKFTVGQF